MSKMIPKRSFLSLVLKRFQSNEARFNFNSDTLMQHKVVHEYTPQRFRPLALPRYGGVNVVTMLPGGGIGPEMMDVVKRVFEETRAPVSFENISMKPTPNIDECNADFADGLLSIRRNGTAIKGHIETQMCDPTQYSRNVALRHNLDLYVNLISYKSYPGIETAVHQGIDLVVIRQNTEGEYLMLEHEPVARSIVENMKIVTAYNTDRLARYAFEYARANGRKKVECVHRRHVLPVGDGLFADTIRKVAAEYPDIGYFERTANSTIRGLTTKPQEFDVIVCTNLCGSLLSNFLFGIMGSPALCSSRNYGDHYAVFETGHRGKGKSMTGKGIANPIAMLNAAVDLLRYLRHDYHACLISKAIEKTINVDKVHTYDLGGTACTKDVVDNILKRVADSKCQYPDPQRPSNAY